MPRSASNFLPIACINSIRLAARCDRTVLLALNNNDPRCSAPVTDLVILDFDGVVADSEVISLGSLQSALKDFGVVFDLPETRRRFLGKSLNAIKADASQIAPEGKWDGFENHWHSILFERFSKELVPVAGVADFLARLKADGLPYCIASSSGFERIYFALSVMKLTDHFPCVYSAQQVTQGKPAPDLFLYAARSMNIAPERCVVIEDSPYGILAARAAGMRSIGFLGGQHLAGSQKSHRQLLLAQGAHEIVDALDEITFEGQAHLQDRV
ncbi:HAD family hydrolase [Primorskyibacter flagellatus]|uniref:HAD family hydrolase n=1 Tax=Primorskyibacter flagellatus TaxID=1387277 RepID=UPI000A042BBD|nr:HAD family phosphatase [Primorskyibacter flagellatus]